VGIPSTKAGRYCSRYHPNALEYLEMQVRTTAYSGAIYAIARVSTRYYCVMGKIATRYRIRLMNTGMLP